MRDFVGKRCERLGVALALLSLSACGSGDKPAAEAPAAEAPAPAEAKAAAEAKPEAAKPEAEKAELSDTASDPSFLLQLKPAGTYSVGKMGTLVLDLEPREPYHVNQEYPMTVTVRAPEGITVPKTELAKADAAEYGESKARFEVPITPAAQGEHRIEAHVRFAVCTPETCVPDERTLALAVAVE